MSATLANYCRAKFVASICKLDLEFASSLRDGLADYHDVCSPTDPSSNKSFMMDDLPIELLHNVFSYLKPHEIPPLRQVCRILAAVGLHYMIPELHLLPLPGNFDRLAEVANRPVLSQHLHKKFYGGNKLPSCVSRVQFDELILDNSDFYWTVPTGLPRYLPVGDSEDSIGKYHKERRKVLAEQIPETSMETA